MALCLLARSMDLDLARTFLEIVRYGSLASAAQNLHVTQTAVTARVQKLESLLGVTLFIRNRAGAKLTPEGEAFVVYANQLLHTWEAARRDLPRPEGLAQVLHIAGEVSLCNPLILSWTQALRQHLSSHAVRVQIRDGEHLLRQVEMGLLDAALVYRPAYWPGVQVEQLLEEKLIQIRRPARPDPYVYVDWGRISAFSTMPPYRKRRGLPSVSTSGRWRCITSLRTAAVAISARGWCKAT